MSYRVIQVNILCASAVLFAANAVATRAVAQTLVQPSKQTRSLPPRDIAKSGPTRQAKSCSSYGAGFVPVPGTDGCVKIGAFVEGEASAGR
jgi:Porin subfamily